MSEEWWLNMINDLFYLFMKIMKENTYWKY